MIKKQLAPGMKDSNKPEPATCLHCGSPAKACRVSLTAAKRT
ncbi:MAG: hypothetical protein U9O82_13380 [Thermodesulfobacteriota bacterium]|nr:hypothetical protein [Thermodesulfobacteriota bacterium]